jgi:hypothetical protein
MITGFPGNRVMDYDEFKKLGSSKKFVGKTEM